MHEKMSLLMQFFNDRTQKIDNLSNLIKKNPYNAQLYAELAYLYYKEYNFDLAERNCRQAIILNPMCDDYKKLLNDITLKYINYYGKSETYKIKISNLIS